jgi:AcrR family transcriptional regulator
MSPRTPEQFHEIRQEKKTLIMDVALEYFASEGYHNTSISQIAKKAGISKGLMYNYFASKEELLKEIFNKSMLEISNSFDPDKDGHLSEEEFELFVRRYFHVLREKLSFWRLFFQLMMQKVVRDQILKAYFEPDNSGQISIVGEGNFFLTLASKMIADYFIRKKDKKPSDYDPILDMHMFIYTIEGFAKITTYLDNIDEVYFEKTVNRIIEVYK